MKRNWKSNLLSIVFFILLLIGCRQKESGLQQNEEYTCPMHPQIIKYAPGTCPICGMDLVKKKINNNAYNYDAGIEELVKPTNSISVSNIKTVVPINRKMEVNISANGVVTYDTRKAYTIPVRFGGRIEKLFIKYNFQPIRKGQKVLEIYSPEIVSAQRELLFLLSDDPDNRALIESSRQKLRLLGLSEAQILELTKSKKERYTVAVYSPYSGYIVEETFINNLPTESVSAPPENGMGGMAENDPSAASPVSSSNPTALKIREGQYLNAGQSVFKVVDTERLWAEFDLKQRDIGYIRQNDQVFVELTPNGQKIKATVSQVRPFLNSGESFAKVRVDLNNSDSRIKVGTLVAGNFKKNIENASWIPTSALVDLGNESVVFVKTKDVFQSRKIITGVQTGDFTEVIKGIEPGDEIAENGQFMVDSESFIRSEN